MVFIPRDPTTWWPGVYQKEPQTPMGMANGPAKANPFMNRHARRTTVALARKPKPAFEVPESTQVDNAANALFAEWTTADDAPSATRMLLTRWGCEKWLLSSSANRKSKHVSP